MAQQIPVRIMYVCTGCSRRFFATSTTVCSKCNSRTNMIPWGDYVKLNINNPIVYDENA